MVGVGVGVRQKPAVRARPGLGDWCFATDLSSGSPATSRRMRPRRASPRFWMAHRRAWISSSRCLHSSPRVWGSRHSGANLQCLQPSCLIRPCPLAGLAQVADHPSISSLLQVDRGDYWCGAWLGVLQAYGSHQVCRPASWRPQVATDWLSVHQGQGRVFLSFSSLLTRLGGHS